MALTIFIKFCEFIEQSKPNNLTLSDFIAKFPEEEKFCANVAPKPSDGFY